MAVIQTFKNSACVLVLGTTVCQTFSTSFKSCKRRIEEASHTYRALVWSKIVQLFDHIWPSSNYTFFGAVPAVEVLVELANHSRKCTALVSAGKNSGKRVFAFLPGLLQDWC